MKIANFEKAEWIDPWNDRRPMTEDWVLVTVFDPEDNHKYVTESKYEDGYGWFMDDEISILGWMPLPEPMGGFMPYDIKPKFGEEWTRQ